MVERGGKATRRSRVADGSPAAGSGPPSVRHAPAGRRRAVPRVRRGHLATLCSQVEIDGSIARGAGVDPEDPPLRWEVSQARRRMGRGQGARRSHRGLQLRSRRRRAADARGRRGSRRWPGARCAGCGAGSPSRRARGGPAAVYTHPPGDLLDRGGFRRRAGAGRACGAGVDESLGTSDGTPGQSFPLRFSPVLAADRRGEARGARTRRRPVGSHGRWWSRSRSRAEPTGTSSSTPTGARSSSDPRCASRTAAGRQYGAIPPQGARPADEPLPPRGRARRATSPPRRSTVLRSAIPGVASVINPTAGLRRRRPRVARVARASARAMEIRTRYRAVTAEDYEFLVTEASSRVGPHDLRSRRRADRAIRVHILPRVGPADRQLTLRGADARRGVADRGRRHISTPAE